MPEFKLDEKLFRKIPSVPGYVVEGENGRRISSAAFKDSSGCSVDRQLERDESIIYNQLWAKFQQSKSGIQAVANVTYAQCLDIKTLVLKKPEDDNIYHCEIHSSDEKIQLTSSQARHLAKNAIVKYF